jgi:hypothetical protein
MGRLLSQNPLSMKAAILLAAAAFLFAGCSKITEAVVEKTGPETLPRQFIKYTIERGNQYSTVTVLDTTSNQYLDKARIVRWRDLDLADFLFRVFSIRGVCM